MIRYSEFLELFDRQLELYQQEYKNYIFCKKGCSACCEKGDYPLSQIELEYLMLGYSKLDNSIKKVLQNNFSMIKKCGVCPFLINKECSVYKYRPIVCRVHGLAYLNSQGKVVVPYCVNEGKNYFQVYKDNEFFINPIRQNLSTQFVLKDFNFGEIRDLYDWLVV